MPKSRNPPLVGFTPEMHLLTDIADLLYKRFAQDPKAHFPRPLTAADHLSLAKRQAGINRIVAKFSPQHAHLTPTVRA
ncbi:hypothetical protein [Nocardia aurea]|uniref:hypothetical protein n=1 Tax=Nocardia aurea TaxID=2144174 RepID=UPI0033AA7DB8